MSDFVEIVDVSPRDGLQSQPVLLDTSAKLELIQRLVDSGIRRMEAVSFVNPKRVPQMADAELVVKGLPQQDGLRFIGLVLNMRGYERAVATGIDEINCVVVASETFSMRNQGASLDQTMQNVTNICKQAETTNIANGVTVAAAFGCPFEGEIPQSQVINLVERLADIGYKEIALADTIGVASPSDVSRLLTGINRLNLDIKLRCHFHNTRNTAVANTYVAIQEGVRSFDASCGGVGGCPFAPAATGNVATEDLLYMIHRMGMRTNIDIDKVIETAKWLEGPLQASVPSMLSKAGVFPKPD
ncbi:MAG: (R)-citramalyl-CoA lyase [Porticoccaceae bacterium UBA1117]|nr:MAG: (R)-citramalyl-CoA lyase [Porticoccaceae bacterium UBA1117]